MGRAREERGEVRRSGEGGEGGGGRRGGDGENGDGTAARRWVRGKRGSEARRGVKEAAWGVFARELSAAKEALYRLADGGLRSELRQTRRWTERERDGDAGESRQLGPLAPAGIESCGRG